jgi:hypothetical protein
MADVMTFEEHRGPIAGRTVAWTAIRQQRHRLLDPRRRALRLRAQHRLPAGTSRRAPN